MCRRKAMAILRHTVPFILSIMSQASRTKQTTEMDVLGESGDEVISVVRPRLSAV